MALAAALACAGLQLPGEAFADPPAGSNPNENDGENAEQRMLELNEAGFAAFAEGEFIEAAQKFEEAHAYVPDPILRKNAAIAWFKAERCEEASEAAVFFLLADEMTVKDRVEARSVLGHCRLEEAEEAVEAGEVDRARGIVERVTLLQTDERVDERLAAVRMQLGGHALDDAEGGYSRRETAGWALVATGAAIVAGNIGYHIASDDSQGSDTADWLVPTLYGAGALTSGTGVWLLVSDEQETAKPAAQKAPAPAVQVGMTFKF